MALAHPPKLVVLRALGVGDLLTGVPALRALADAFPEHERVLAAPAPLAPLAALTGAVHRVEHVRELEPLPPALGGADLAVNLHGRGPQSHRLLSAARPRRTIWFEHPELPETRGSPRWRPGEREAARWCRLLEESGVPANASRLALEPPACAPQLVERARGATLIHPGAAYPARRWPVSRFAAVARAEASAGRRVVVTGGPAEVELARSVAAAAGPPGAHVLAGCTDLSELAGVVAAAARVVCGDTGVAHLATALGTPSVVLFGPSAPSEWGPPPGNPRHRVLWRGWSGDPHGERPDPGLLAIEVEDVLAALALLPAVDAEGRAARRAA
ncbi:MAG: glycosyltransferase family 9 protein [Nocardioidaceae bacterium]